MTDRIADIAKGLPADMRDCIRQLDPGLGPLPAWWLARIAGYPAEGSYMVHKIKSSGLFASEFGNQGCNNYKLNETGIAVRDYLQGEEQWT